MVIFLPVNLYLSSSSSSSYTSHYLAILYLYNLPPVISVLVSVSVFFVLLHHHVVFEMFHKYQHNKILVVHPNNIHLPHN
jgi:hypothetical protein